MPLHGDGEVIGTLLVGDRLGDVETFAASRPPPKKLPSKEGAEGPSELRRPPEPLAPAFDWAFVRPVERARCVLVYYRSSRISLVQPCV